MFYKILFILSFLFSLNGCLSQIESLDESTQFWVGRPIRDLQDVLSRPESYPSRIGWRETTYSLPSGNWVYIEPVRPDCYVHWEVNSRGLIEGYRSEGNRCY